MTTFQAVGLSKLPEFAARTGSRLFLNIVVTKHRRLTLVEDEPPTKRPVKLALGSAIFFIYYFFYFF